MSEMICPVILKSMGTDEPDGRTVFGIVYRRAGHGGEGE